MYLQFDYPKDRSRDSTVGIATRNGLEGPETNPCRGGGAKLFVAVQTGSEAHPTTYITGTGSFLGVKRPGVALTIDPDVA
jgi:hypothetical protein